jgi:hypothetical protein
VIAAIPPFTGV